MTLPVSQESAAGALVVPLPEFRLQPGEPLGTGLKRISLAELESAVSMFYDGEVAFSEAVHNARKTTKRIRALLHLIKSEIGEKVFRYENAVMRDSAALLAEVRSSAMVAVALDGIRAAYGPLLADGVLEETGDRLALRRERVEERVIEDPEIVPRVVETLERAYSRYSSWPTDPEMRRVYGVGVRDGYEAVGPGLLDTYRRGRRDMVVAYRGGGPAEFHSWRKRVRYLRHQFEILTPVWPEVMLGMALTFARISDLLGEDHDLAELLALVAGKTDICPDPAERSLLRALAGQRRSDLETAARILGRRVFAESPDALAGRVGAYWDSMEMARAVSY